MKKKILAIICIAAIFMMLAPQCITASNVEKMETETLTDPENPPYYERLTGIPLKAVFPIESLTKTPKYIELVDPKSGILFDGLYFNIVLEGKCDYIKIGGELDHTPVYYLENTNVRLEVKIMFGYVSKNDDRIKVQSGSGWAFGMGLNQFKLRITPL